MSDEDAAAAAAWKIHDTLVTWTGQVDTKASFALAIESAAMVGILSLAGDGHRLAGAEGAAMVLLWIGVALLAGALVAVGYVVRPRVREGSLPNEAPDNYIFFGHLQYWDPTDLAESLTGSDDLLRVLSRQLVTMSKIAWSKHYWLKVSMSTALAAIAMVALAAALNR